MNENHSTGPRTEEGKLRSSQNSLKHGLFSQNVILPGEREEDYDKLCYRYKRDYQPKDVTEEDLVRVLVQTEWRRRRLPALETEAVGHSLETGDTERKFINTYGVYEQRLNRAYQSTLKLLKETQATRKQEQAVRFRMAVVLRKHNKKKDNPWNPADDGFVFSTVTLDRTLDLQNRIREANDPAVAKVTEEELDLFMAREAE